MLEGIRIVDLTTVVFGPLATRLLADMGADVVKVEVPGGDVFRFAGRPAKTRGMGPHHMTLGRGKTAITLDLKHDADAARLRDMIAGADIFIHNVRAQAIERLGFGYDAAKALKPDLIYVHCAGFGQDGPYAPLQAYDDLIQAGTGTTSLLGRVDGDPRPRYLPSLIADKLAAHYASQAMLAAIVHRLRTGEGQHVEVPMFECFAHFMLEEHLSEAVFDPPTGPIGYGRQLDPNRQPFPTSDGHVSIVPYTDTQVRPMLEILGDASLLDGPDFQTPKDRHLNMHRIYAEIARLTPSKTSAEWVDLFQAANVPAMACRDLADIFEDTHLAATGFFRHRQHPTEGGFWEMRPPVRFGADKGRELGFAPPLDLR